MPDKPPLIASQGILLLDPSIRNPREFLRPQRYRAAQLRVATTSRQDAVDPDAKAWHPISFRQLFTDSGIRRLGLAAEAGIGKSTALQRAQHEIMQADARVLAIYARLGDLPKTAADYVRLPGTADRPPNAEAGCLVRIMCQDLGCARTDRSRTERTIQRLMREGDTLLYRLAQDGWLVLLVDALDQISRGDGGDVPSQIRALARFLDWIWPRQPRGDRRSSVCARPFLRGSVRGI